MTVLIAGATGFLGQHVAQAFDTAGDDYVSLSRSAGNGGVRMDLLDPLKATLPGNLEAVIHCASVIPSAGEAEFTDNVTMTANLLDLLQPGVETFVLISSVSVYCAEQTPSGKLTEDATTFSASPYGISKRRQEEVCEQWAADNNVRLVVLRPSSIYGPGQRTNTLLPRMCETALQNKPLPVFAPLGYRQNFVSVHDVADLAVSAVRGTMTGTFNAFSDDTLSALQLAERIVQLTESSSVIQHEPTDKDVTPLSFPNEKTKQAFRHSFRDIDSGIRELADHMASTCHG